VGSLSQLLSLYPVRTALDVQCRFAAPWVLDHDAAATGVVPYHVIVRGQGYLEVAGRKDIPLQAGDVILFPKGAPHRLYSHQAQGAQEIPLHSLDAAPLRLVYNEGGAPDTGILCGQFEFSSESPNALLSALPDVVHVATRGDGEFGVLRNLIEILRLEAEEARPGGRIVISQLASALFALVMRAWLEQGTMVPSLFALLTEPRLSAALQAILHAPERPWKLAELASACNMSRATFVRVFRKVTDATPAEILTQTRMARAALLLTEGRLPVGHIAEQVGYQSEAAFSRLFKRHHGQGPGAYRRRALPRAGK
jgi:AraC family transcriptional activator of mtrCDE